MKYPAKSNHHKMAGIRNALNTAIHVKKERVSAALYVRTIDGFDTSKRMVARVIPTAPLTSQPPKLLRGTL